MENLYDTPDEVNGHGLNTTHDSNHNDSDDGEYVNAKEAILSKALDVQVDDDDHEYSEITRTVTVTKDQENGSVTETKVTVTKTIHTTDDVKDHIVDVSDEDDDVINQRSDIIVRKSDVTEQYDDVSISDVISRYSDAENGSSYENVGGVSVTVELDGERNSAQVEIGQHGNDASASLVVEKILDDEMEREDIVERLVEREMNQEHEKGDHTAAEELRERREREEASYEGVDGNLYEYIEESRVVEREREEEEEYRNVESQQQQQHQHQLLLQENDEKEEGDIIYDETYSTPRDAIQRREEVRTETRSEIEAEYVEPINTTTTTTTVSFSANSNDQDHNSIKKTQQNNSSGKFVMRAISRADPGHVIQCITQNSDETSQHNPEQDELVRYIKGDTEASEFTRMKSWITSPLIQQFNKEGQSGSEVGQSFAPRNVGVTTTRSSGGSTVTREIRSVTSPTSPVAPGKVSEVTVTREVQSMTSPTSPVASSRVSEVTVNNQSSTLEGQVTRVASETQKAIVVSPSGEKPLIDALDDPLKKNSEIAKAVEAAEFKPVAHKPNVAQTNGVDPGKKDNESRTSGSSTQGLSVYSKQSITKSENSVEVKNIPKQNTYVQTADWKMELERRKQTKEFLVAQKPNQPLKLAEVPEWKKVLVEKNKQRKSTSADLYDEPSRVSGGGEEDELEWKKEMKQILKQKSITEGTIDQQSEVPEWQKIADSKK